MNGVIRGGRYLENAVRYYRSGMRFQKDKPGTTGQNIAQIGFLCEWCSERRELWEYSRDM